MGGRLLQWMDIVAAIAKDIPEGLGYTISVNNVSFGHPIPQAQSIVTLESYF